jgi:hypothetical protein
MDRKHMQLSPLWDTFQCNALIFSQILTRIRENGLQRLDAQPLLISVPLKGDKGSVN